MTASCSTFKEAKSGSGAFCWDIVKRLDAAVTCKKKNTHTNSAFPLDTPTHYWVDFGREFQGGLILDVPNGNAGQNVSLKCGESITPAGVVGTTWGAFFFFFL